MRHGNSKLRPVARNAASAGSRAALSCFAKALRQRTVSVTAISRSEQEE